MGLGVGVGTGGDKATGITSGIGGAVAETLFHALADASGRAIVLVDRAIKILYVNPTTLEMTGLAPADLVGRAAETVWPKTTEEVRPLVQRAFETQEIVRSTSLSFGLNHVMCEVIPVRPGGGAPLEHFVIVLRDAKDAEAEGTGFTHSGQVLVDAFARLARLTYPDHEAVLRETLEFFSREQNMDRVIVRLISPDGRFMIVGGHYDAPGLPPLTHADEPIDAYAATLDGIGRGQTLITSSIDSIPESNKEARARLEAVGCRAACVVPLVDGQKLIGRLAFATVRERAWPLSLVWQLRAFAEMFGTALSRARREADLRERLRFEEALTTLSARLLDMTSEGFDTELIASLEAVSRALHIDRAIVTLLDEAKEHFVVTHEWCAPGIASFDPLGEKITVASVGWPLTEMSAGMVVNATFDEVPEHAVAARALMERQGIRAVARIPLRVNGEVIGGIAFHSLKAATKLQPEAIARLQVVSHVIASGVARLRATDSLSESEDRFVQVIESALDGVVLLDETGVVLDWTQQSARLFGRDRHEMVGRKLAEVALDEASSSLLDLASAPWVRELTGVRADGSLVPVEVSASPMKRSGARIYSLFVRDITDRKQAEAAKQRAFDEVSRQKESAERERDYLREELSSDTGSSGVFVAESPALRHALESLDAVAGTSAAVLLHGESGVGKEVFARALHARSPRSRGPLVRVNCASIPESLFESEFFGHVRGSFTGAHKDRVGRFELADGGTIFLDEVGEIPIEMQAKLLRVLQEGEFERVGEDKTRKVNARVVAATNRDLAVEVREGRFRRDLYFRLSVFPIEIPPLRERLEDIVPLAREFLRRAARAAGRPSLKLTPMQEAHLLEYDWPGNVRELQHTIERAVILSSVPPLQLERAMVPVSGRGPMTSGPAPSLRGASAEKEVLTADALKKLERDNVLAALEQAKGRVSGRGGAAEILQMSASTLRDRIKALGIVRR